MRENVEGLDERDEDSEGDGDSEGACFEKLSQFEPYTGKQATQPTVECDDESTRRVLISGGAVEQGVRTHPDIRNC